MSRRWGERLKRLPRPAAQENRKGRGPHVPTAAAAPGGLAAATPPQGGSDGKNEARAGIYPHGGAGVFSPRLRNGWAEA